MAAQKGKDLLLKVDDGSSNFVTVAGIRTQRLALNADTVDTTHQQSAGQWRELLAGGGIRRASIAGNGLFKDAATDALIRQIFFDAVIRRWQVIVPSFGIVEGLFQITSLDYRGDHVAEVTFEIALESAGELTFVAV
jgi:TP901-1 family phage major tail protein